MQGLKIGPKIGTQVDQDSGGFLHISPVFPEIILVFWPSSYHVNVDGIGREIHRWRLYTPVSSCDTTMLLNLTKLKKKRLGF